MGFNLTVRYYNTFNTTVTLEWDLPPQDGSPAAVVNNYTIFVHPVPLSHSAVSLVFSPPWNVTLSHNIPYTINITARNCVGESEPISLPDRVLIGRF